MWENLLRGEGCLGSFPAFPGKNPLESQGKRCYDSSNKDRGAEETALREPTGKDRSGSNSAELKRQVCRFGGAGENISGTVRGRPRGRYLLTGNSPRHSCVRGAIVGRGRFLCRFFVAQQSNVWRKHYEI